MDAVMDREIDARELVSRARDGDRAAFEELVDRYRGRIAAFLRSRLGEELSRRVDMEDLLQEVFLRAYTSLGRFHWAGDDAFFRWLSVIARHAIHEAARRHGRELLLPSDADLSSAEISPFRVLRRAERMARLRMALDRLKPAHREVILLARIQRLPVREVAERMGRSPNATTQLLLRALEKLKAAFGDTESLSLPDERLIEETGAEDAENAEGADDA